MIIKSKIKNRIYLIFALFGIMFGSLSSVVLNTDVKAGGEETGKIADANNVTQQTRQFVDVSESDWFYSYVIYLTDNKIVNGMTETQFEPKGTFTVAQSAAIITRYLNLETEAEERKNAMSLLGVSGADKWYAGYIQLMHEAGIIDVTEYGCSINGSSISIDRTDLLDAPVKRYEFAAFVTRSFELEGTLFSGVQNNNFIYGGKYNESELELYIPFIKDYADIPTEYNYYVLKAYYNGIFNGDDLGNFNPNNDLTRAEMAKVTAVIMNSDLRTRIDISNAELSDTYLLSEDDFIIKKQEKILKPDVTDAILESEAKGIKVSNLSGNKHIEYLQQKKAPDGYEFQVRHYRKSSDGFDTEISDTAKKTTDVNYKNDFIKNDKFILLLKKAFTGEIIDAYQVSFNMLGEAVYSHLSYNP